MNLENSSFYKGLTIGIITGMVLNTIKKYIFNSKLINPGIKCLNKADGSIQPEAKSSSKSNGEFKIALLVRHDLKMGKGKVAAQCAVVSITAYNKGKLKGLPSKCARIVLRAPDLKSLECIQKQCKLFDIQTATFIEDDQVTVLAIGPADEFSINSQVQHLKLYS